MDILTYVRIVLNVFPKTKIHVCKLVDTLLLIVGVKGEVNKLMRAFLSYCIFLTVGFCNGISLCSYQDRTSRATYVPPTYIGTKGGSTHPLPRAEMTRQEVTAEENINDPGGYNPSVLADGETAGDVSKSSPPCWRTPFPT